tara:strand:+ start:536 stop:985 length:450 start_codon:yes stop_codon:yes gene_type:complete
MEIDQKFTFAFAAYLLNRGEGFVTSEDEAKRRMNICQYCDKFQLLPPPKEEEEAAALMERFGKTEPFHGCTLCGCLLEHKVEVLFERCPILKWYPMMSGEQEGEMEQWKKYHKEFMELYNEREDGDIDWYAKTLNRDIIQEELSGDKDE